jgi:hypothetical protein
LHELFTVSGTRRPPFSYVDGEIRWARRQVDWLATLPAQAAQAVLKTYRQAWMNYGWHIVFRAESEVLPTSRDWATPGCAQGAIQEVGGAGIKEAARRVRPDQGPACESQAPGARLAAQDDLRFGISERDTLKTWTVLETVLSVAGFVVAAVLSLFL